MKRIKRAFLAILMMFSLTSTAFAAEIPVECTESTPLTREEAIEILGLTEEEADKVKIYELSQFDNNSEVSIKSIPGSCNPGVYYEDISFNSGFTGAAHQLNGSKYKYGFRLDSDLGGQLAIGSFSYNSNWIYNNTWCELTTSNRSYQSDWENIEYGQYYYFKYVYYNYGKIPAKVRVAIAVY